MSAHGRQRPSHAPSPQCEVCGRALRLKQAGRPRIYCSDACRQKAARARGIINLLVAIDRINVEVTSDPITDWSDELHRVA